MNTTQKKTTLFSGAFNQAARNVRRTVLAAATLLLLAANANAASYEFKVVRTPSDGTVQNVVLINTATGLPEPDVIVEVVHAFYMPHRKGTLNIKRTFVSLQDHLVGKCNHPESESPTGSEITVMAKMPGKFWPVWGTVDLSD